MKNDFHRIIAFILLISTMLGIFSVLSFATDEETEQIADTVNVIVNRTFEEGWELTNGLSGQYKKQKLCVDSEELADFSYNHYARIEVVHFGERDNDGMIELKDSQISTGGTVLEYDIKSDVYTNSGSAYFLTPYVNTQRVYQTMFTLSENKYIIDNGKRADGKSTKVTVGSIANNWVHVANVYNFDKTLRYCSSCKTRYYTEQPASNPYDLHVGETCSCGGTEFMYCISVSTYFGYSKTFDHTKAINVSDVTGTEYDLDNTYVSDTYIVMVENALPQINVFRIGTIGIKEGSVGQGFLLDNVKLYNDMTPKDEEGNPSLMTIRPDITQQTHGYGTAVNPNKPFDVEIKGSSTQFVDYLSSAMFMKVNSDYLLLGDERHPIFTNEETGTPYGAPLKRDGVIYIPFEPLLNATGYPVFVHDDGLQYDISTAGGASVLTLYRSVAVVNGKRVNLTAAPFMATDPDNPENTYPVIAMEDLELFFPGYYVTYDEMGLIGISEGQDIFTREGDISVLTGIMKKFIFDDPTEDELYAMIEENTDGFTHPYLVSDQDNFDYLNSVYKAHLAKEAGEEYDESLIDETLYSYFTSYIASVEKLFTKFTTLPAPELAANYTFREKANERNPEKYKYLVYEITNPFYGIKDGVVYSDDSSMFDYAGPADENGDYWGKLGPHYNDGYDWGGSRNTVIVNYADYILQFGLVYQITRDVRYAQLAYDIMISLCDNDNWHNWGQKHHLALAEMLMRLGFGYDWLYNVWSEIQSERADEYNLAYITQKIYRKAIFYSYENTRYSRHVDVWTKDHVTSTRDSQGRITGIWNWSTVAMNWNGVCNSGITVGSMAIVGEMGRLEGVDFTADGEDGCDRVKWCMRNNLQRIWKYGLEQYAPDGSYIEGASYWGYATNYITMVMWAVDTAVGDDLGLHEAWGFDKTYYFAIQAEYSVNESNSKYALWAFHDCGGGVQDTYMYFFAADMLGDEGLAAVRMEQIKCGKSLHWADILGYKPEYATLTLDDAQLDLDMKFENLEGAVSRSSWEAGHTYAGIMGNRNDCGNHGQMDSGIFTYVDDGFAWFPDLGSDNYNIYEYFGYGIRQYYYRNSAEGHNQVIITSQPDAIPFGQVYAAGGVLTDYYSEDAGMYAIVDNKSVYAPFATFARRGMLVTNNRETVVIQDEISFTGAESVAWIAHTRAEIRLSDDKKTAWLSKNVDGEMQWIRVSIVSNDTKLKFETMTCGVKEQDGKVVDSIIDGIKTSGYSLSNGGVNEKSRKDLRRLVIKATSTLAFNCAVVIEDVKGMEDTMPVQYKFMTISAWAENGITSDTYVPGENTEENAGASEIITNAKLGDITTYTKLARQLLEKGYAFDTRTIDFFRNLVRVTSAVNTYRPEGFKSIPQVWSAYEEYLVLLQHYNTYSGDINRTVQSLRNISKGLCGM